VWEFNSPTWKFSTRTYNQTAAAFNNPDCVTIVIGNYRWRQGLHPSEPEYASTENKLQQAPVIAVPTITIDGEHDPFTPPGDGAAYRDKFTSKHKHRVFPIGHNVPQEALVAFAQAVIDVSLLIGAATSEANRSGCIEQHPGVTGQEAPALRIR
jgi:pimeloyl-ACP methyl ester carboxylesterase